MALRGGSSDYKTTPCEERNGQRAEEEQGAREETDRWKVNLPVCWVGRRNQRTGWPKQSGTFTNGQPDSYTDGIQMHWRWLWKDRQLDIERGRPADRVAGR